MLTSLVLFPVVCVGVQRPERSDSWGDADGEKELWVGLWKGWGTVQVFCSIFLKCRLTFKTHIWLEVKFPHHYQHSSKILEFINAISGKRS